MWAVRQIRCSKQLPFTDLLLFKPACKLRSVVISVNIDGIISDAILCAYWHY